MESAVCCLNVKRHHDRDRHRADSEEESPDGYHQSRSVETANINQWDSPEIKGNKLQDDGKPINKTSNC